MMSDYVLLYRSVREIMIYYHLRFPMLDRRLTATVTTTVPPDFS